jgi:hypothetical protein
MEKDWVLLYSSTIMHDVHLKRIYLAENGIESVIINKKDSIYQSFGDIELYVNRNEILKAKKLIDS